MFDAVLSPSGRRRRKKKREKVRKILFLPVSFVVVVASKFLKAGTLKEVESGSCLRDFFPLLLFSFLFGILFKSLFVTP